MGVNFSDLVPVPTQIETGRGSFGVSGLSLKDISGLLSEYAELIASFMNGDTLDFKAMATKSPELAARVIALASDATGQEGTIQKLPVHVQIEALTSIWSLTVPDVKKLKELLSGVVATLSEEAKPVQKDPQPQT